MAPLDECQVGGCCGVYAVLSCIRELLRRDNNDCDPSLQDPISCCLSNGNSETGWKVSDVLEFVFVYGLPVEDDCPFTGDDDRCFSHKPGLNQEPIQRRIHIGGYKVSGVDKVNAVQDLIELIRTHGPVVVTLFVGEEFGDNIRPPKLDEDGLFVYVKAAPSREFKIFGHALLLTDHKVIKDRGFWEAKNWYGPDWGDRGCIKIDDKLTNMFDQVAYVTSVSLSAPKAKLEVESDPNSPAAWLKFFEEFPTVENLFD